MEEWTPIFMLPNLDLGETAEGGIVAIAHPSDPRLTDVAFRHPEFAQFVGRFKDAFGVRLTPYVLMLRSDAAPQFFDLSALLAFRDAVAVTTVTHARAQELTHPRGWQLMYGDYFQCYPWMLAKDWSDLIAHSPSFGGVHELAKFNGQGNPSLPIIHGRGIGDGPLIAELTTRWRSHFANPAEGKWEDVALFRSLNMAYHASLMPTVTGPLHYDIGRLVSLWVSAFEILVHPEGKEEANRDKVFDLLERVEWQSPKSQARLYETGSRKRPVLRTLASSLYNRLNDVRNDYLHGNAVTGESLVVRPRNRGIYEFAAPLYRAALATFLNLKVPTKDAAYSAETEYLAHFINQRREFEDPRRAVEDGLLTALLAEDLYTR